ncbi:carbon-nitrogen hydrolase family protein [Streptomyces bambusae]|uniref:carbon-nitrogen hydrolase family protein n=1 Tax=Streptomyces bambusae TaxID=1550616 RepID=UPI001CFD9FF9|nr:carbon-nitrogen hydrolase family protein [Streptomyces bambusae]MCB5164864.1 carbon-nitrogen hydrolase family protein [Streptomyces bambusae]
MRIAAAQLTCVPADVKANVAEVVRLAGAAREAGAELVVFPELALTGYEIDALRADRGLWTGPEDPRLDPVRSSGIATVVNCAAPTGGPLPALTTFVYAADGSLLTTYAKQCLYEQEQGVFEPGTRDGRFTLGGTGFSLATCYDNHFPELTGRGASDGCRVHLASSLYGTGGGVQERATVYPAIAAATGMAVVLANHVGPAGPWTGCGRSAVWGPDGTLLAEADAHTATVASADLPAPPA